MRRLFIEHDPAAATSDRQHFEFALRILRHAAVSDRGWCELAIHGLSQRQLQHECDVVVVPGDRLRDNRREYWPLYRV